MEKDLTPQVMRLPMEFIGKVSSPSELAARSTPCTITLPTNNTGERRTIATSVPTELIESLQSAYGSTPTKPEGPPNQIIEEGSKKTPTCWEDLSWFTRVWWCVTHYFEWSKRRAIGNAACMLWMNSSLTESDRDAGCVIMDIANRMWDEEFQRYMKWKNK